MSKNRDSILQDRTSLIAVAAIIAIGGLIYELILGTASSYLLGNSILSFSIGIGFNLFGMGLGSLISIRFLKNAEKRFLQNELILSLIGGFSVVILFAAFNLTELFWLVYVVLSMLIGICVGLEIPLVMSIIEKKKANKNKSTLSKVLAADYIGALIGSLIFPFILLPYLGVIRTAFIVGVLNISVVLFLMKRRKKLAGPAFQTGAYIVLAILICGFIFSTKIENTLTVASYKDQVVYFDTSQYQRIVITQYKDDTRLYLNNQLQFSSVDEHRYHETLAHTVLSRVDVIDSVLILGGGDGMLAREVLTYDEVDSLTIVDLDSEVTDLAKNHPVISRLNKDSLDDQKVQVVNEDAFNYVRGLQDNSFDVILIDLIDPANERVSKLYSSEFYNYASRILSENGVLATQATSTFYTPRAFWSIHATVDSVFSRTVPMSVNVPSFGEWGFVVGSKAEMPENEIRQLPDNLKFYNEALYGTASQLNPLLLASKHSEVSTLLDPSVIYLYNRDLSQWSTQ